MMSIVKYTLIIYFSCKQDTCIDVSNKLKLSNIKISLRNKKNHSSDRVGRFLHPNGLFLVFIFRSLYVYWG